MLRHFAVATGAIMFLLIMFATGEVGEMRDAEAAAQRAAMARAEKAAMDKLSTVAPERPHGLTVVPGAESGYVPVGDDGAGGGSSSEPFTVGPGGGDALANRPGVDPRLAGAQLQASDFEAMPVPGAPGTPPPTPAAKRKKKLTQTQLDDMIAASRARSGNGGTD